MKTSANRRGSALLIVLGMMSFMVISAVAFAAYMRYSRLPSSYLRRNTAGRELVKAALARAIDAIDASIANNPHPGIGDVANKKMNGWKNHIFIGHTNVIHVGEDEMDSETVPVLSLEALAYIPPPLVNDARYYSRRSCAAEWRQFGFDAGRYAFCAIDVSDYFDINRMFADSARASAAGQLLTLAQCFENADHTTAPTGADRWDAFMRDFRDDSNPDRIAWGSSKVPLVSMADFNLAFYNKFGDSGIGGMFSPFVRYVTNQGDGFCDTSAVDSETGRKLAAMTFVTDGLFNQLPPVANSDDDDYDLSLAENQPFQLTDMSAPTLPMLKSVVDYSSKGVSRLYENICGMGMAALWDYLDYDSVPVSLAVPTLERTPMVVGFDISLGNCSFKVDMQKNEINPAPTPAAGAVWNHNLEVKYVIDSAAFTSGFMGGALKTLCIYPFVHRDGIANENFTLDGQLKLCFSVDSPLKLRTGTSNPDDDMLRFSRWKGLSQAGLNNGIIVLPFGGSSSLGGSGSLNVPTSIAKEEDAFIENTFQLSQAASVLAPQFANQPLLTLHYQWQQQATQDPVSGQWQWDASQDFNMAKNDPAKCLVSAKSIGFVKTDATPYADSDLLSALQGGIDKGVQISLNAAIALRVSDRSGKTVDLAPACIKDDDDLNGTRNFQFLGPVATQIAGAPYPLLRLGAGLDNYALNIQNLDANGATPQPVALTPGVCMVADPRFNHAPENWFSTGSIAKTDFLQECKASERDGDIFMATSDQGYLQSPWELAFLPRLTPMDGYGADKMLGDMSNPQDNRNEIGSGFGSARHKKLMWRTYRPFKMNGQARDDFSLLGFTSSKAGMRINPYTDTTNVMMAAFANTPVDWRLASTNNVETGSDSERVKAGDFNSKYAWNQYTSTSGNRFAWQDLTAIAGRFMDEIRNGRARSNDLNTLDYLRDYKAWESVWDDLDWYGDEDRFAGVDLSDETDQLWTCDRKFLFGFWRDCFAVRQQLFLVFVRAEPLMIGGGDTSKIPPQLGARAVALVWREPYESSAQGSYNGISISGYPHRMRVLFYKELE